ncbi:hypothetical protein [Leucobacter manosquensis]|uniref:Uncharacterized protein n=1 Tax=Leucobacter manosquensis TaxID=2810611 RepID=A0ABS5M7X9_9MICO|nr:hypothetical protein [Leucobacter manosquensis]MBS3183314.1 hypothetical protein [Leucobacter manosquensis]
MSAAVKTLPAGMSVGLEEPSNVLNLYQAAAGVDAEEHVLEGARLAERSFLSSCDHVKAFAMLIRTPNRPSTALITVARGAIESAARSLWLIEDVPVGVYLHKVLSMLYADLRHAADEEDALVSVLGDRNVDANERRAYYASEIKRLGLEPVKKPLLTDLVQRLIAETASSTDRGRLYSVYSSIAHGQLAGLNAFVENALDGSTPTLRAPLPVITSVTSQLLLAMKVVCESLVTWLGGQNAPRTRLFEAYERVAFNLKDLPGSAFAPGSIPD